MLGYEFFVKSSQILKKPPQRAQNFPHHLRLVAGPLLSWGWLWTLRNRRCKCLLFLAPPAGHRGTNDGSAEASSSLFQPMWTVAMVATAIKKKRKRKEEIGARGCSIWKRHDPKWGTGMECLQDFPSNTKDWSCRKLFYLDLFTGTMFYSLIMVPCPYSHTLILFPYYSPLLHMTNKVKRDWTMAKIEIVRNVDNVRTSL